MSVVQESNSNIEEQKNDPGASINVDGLETVQSDASQKTGGIEFTVRYNESFGKDEEAILALICI